MIKTVVIGCGAMGVRHIKAISDAKECCFCGVSDLREEALCKAQVQGLDSTFCFTDARKMLETVKPECAVIATTAPGHAPLATMALECGVRYLLVEKPFCTSIAQAVALRKLAEQNEAKIAVNHGMRFDSHYSQVDKLAHSEGLGPIASVLVSGGNMGVAMNASHQFELFRVLTGHAPKTVTAWFAKSPLSNPRGAEFEDAAGQLRLENSQGQRLYIEIGPDQGHGVHMIIHCKFGHLVIDYLAGIAVLSKRNPDQLGLPTTRYGLPFMRETFDLPKADAVATATKVLSALVTGSDYPDAEVGERVVRTLVAAHISNENGHLPVDIDGNLPIDRVFPWA